VSTVVVYSVLPAKLFGAIGSGDAALKKELELGTDPQSRALAALIDGTPQAPKQQPSTALHAFEQLCGHFGRSFTAGFSGTDTELFDKVDAELKAKALPLSLWKLVYGGAPIPLPPSDDFPPVGSLDAVSVASASASMPPDGLVSDDAKIDEALFDLTEWVAVAVARHDMLVGFSY
jgi:hypothetical protein